MAYIAPKDFSQDPKLIATVMKVMGGDLDLSWICLLYTSPSPRDS